MTKKITYIGGNGKVGRIAIPTICSMIPSDQFVEIVLIGSSTAGSLSRLEGFVDDLDGALTLLGKIGNVGFTVTDDYSSAENSTLVLCSACLWPSLEDKEKYMAYDPSGRLVQSLCNAGLVKDIVLQLHENCRDAVVVLVTNQVDIMCHIARKVVPDMQILGLTGGVDSSRLKQIFFRKFGERIEGLMMCYHNNFMMPIMESLASENLTNMDGEKTPSASMPGEIKSDNAAMILESLRYDREKIDSLIHEVRIMGKSISNRQKSGLNSPKNTGASILPATALASVANAYCFGEKTLVESYNVRINRKDVADQYGVPLETDLSIPMIISENSIVPKMGIALSAEEKAYIEVARRGFAKDLEMLGYFA
jgi:malate/lactate dehydrogenase